MTFPALTTSKIRVRVTAAADGVARVTDVEAWEASRANFALASRGAQASASSTTLDTDFPGMPFPVTGIIDGDRKGVNWEHGGGWRDGTNNSYPDWAQVEFAGERSIDEVNVFTLQDATSSPSEPTEATTFTQYGVTAYEVQYLSGADWVTVPGGSVTGNDKVWRKFTFPAVVTSKVRVLVHNALAGRSRLVEVEAWGAAGSTADVRWLVSDQLGTPRMAVEQTGSLIGVTRHDYLPFGEELNAGTDGRASAQGYVAGDNIRQKFTGYERDTETELDFAGARYYSSAMGRFTSMDIFWKDSQIHDPQSWNKYVYVRNNPLKYIDPTGEKVDVAITTDEKNKTGTIHITASIALWTSDQTITQAGLDHAAQVIDKQIESAWSGTYVRDGITYTVTVYVDVQAGYGNDEKAANISGAQNIIEIKNGPVGSGDSDSVVNRRGLRGGPDTGTWNINTLGQGGAQHEFTHLLGVGNKDGAVLSNGNILRDPSLPKRATADDYGWALGGSIDSHRSESRPLIYGGRQWETLNAGGPVGRGAPANHRSERTLRARPWWHGK